MTTAAGGPLFASKPHFLDGDPIYNINVKGMHPVREWHDTNLDVEPITGALMQAAKRIQLNIEIQKVADIPRTGKVPHVLLPLFYANESAVITADLADDFKSQVYLPITASVAIQWTGIALGSLCLGAFLITVALIIRDRKKDKDSQREPLLDKETRAMHINIPGLA